MRFAFAGIDFLSDVFEGLIETGWEPIKLFTRPCDGVYDFNDLVVETARRRRIPIQLSRLTASDLKALAELGCEALVVAGYPWRVPAWQRSLDYALNVHPSPLPIGRGPYPLFRVILENGDSWGVTAHAIEAEFDTGAIRGAGEFSGHAGRDATIRLSPNARLLPAGSRAALPRGLPRLWQKAEPQRGGSYWPRISDAERTIDWSGTVEQALRTVRAFGTIEAMARIGHTPVFVRAASGWTERHRHAPGTLVHSHQRHLVVAVRDGFIHVTRWSPISRTDKLETGR